VLITSEVGDVLVAHLGVDRSRLLGPARLDEDLGLDSLALTEALLALEDELAISIPDPVQAGLHTFDDLVAVVASQLSGTATAHRRCAAVAERSSGGDAGRR
jgi:acyl carrier protein